MRRITLDTTPEAEAIAEALAVLREGGVIAYPTETFYALGALLDEDSAIERIFRLKGRSPDKAISLIAGSPEDMEDIVADIPPVADDLMDEHWPGPLTLVFPAAGGLSPRLTQAGTIAVRVPGDSFALRLVKAAGVPITATSANPAGNPPADSADTVAEYFNSDLDLLIDSGLTKGGLPSTIVDVTVERPRVLRAGAVRITR